MKCDYIFGYGTLVNDKSRYKTLGNKSGNRKTKRNIPGYIDKKYGYNKKYNVTHKRGVALGLEYNTDKSKDISGLLFKVTKKDLNNLSRREKYYRLKRVPSKYFRTKTGRKCNTLKNICTFIPKRTSQLSKTSKNNKNITKEYKNIVSDGFQDYDMPIF